MKKTLLVLATLAATAGFAQAASVTLYGSVDLGLSYKYKNIDTVGSTHQYGLENGNLGASKFGLKGEEELGNGYVVGFKLENSFSADTGKLKKDSTLFDREARVYVKGGFGELSAGRMGGLSSGAGTYDIFQAYGDVFGGGVGDIGAGYWNGTARYNNMLTYVTPDMAGFKVYAQYSFATDDQEKAGTRNNNRYWGVGATYDNGPLGLVLVVDSEMPKNPENGQSQDSYTVSFGGNYDLGSVKPFFGAQYGKHLTSFGFVNEDNFDAKGYKNLAIKEGYAASLGALFQLSCGSLQAGVFYAHTKDITGTDAEGRDWALDKKADLYGIGLVHSYPLSKRTTVYTGVGYNYLQTQDTVGDKYKDQFAQVLFGLNHTF